MTHYIRVLAAAASRSRYKGRLPAGREALQRARSYDRASGVWKGPTGTRSVRWQEEHATQHAQNRR